MAQLREPDEAKTRKSLAAEPRGYQARQNAGLPNDPASRKAQKVAYAHQQAMEAHKNADREQKERHHEEKMAFDAKKANDAALTKNAEHLAKEHAATEKWAADIGKKQEKQNLQDFHNFLYSEYGGVIDDKGTRGIPLDIEKRAAKYMREAATDGAGAAESFKKDFAKEQGLRQEYHQKVRPELIKEAEKANGGDSLNAEQMALIDKASPEAMQAAVNSWDTKQTMTQVKSEAELAKAGETFTVAYPTSKEQRDNAVKAGITPPPMIAGDKQRYRGEELTSGQLPVRPDLSFNEASEAYNDLIDRATAAQGGGALPTAMGFVNKYLPGPREVLDPNTPLRTFARESVIPAVKGTWENIKAGVGGPTAADLVPTLEAPVAPVTAAPVAPVSPAVTTAEPKAAPAIAPEPAGPSAFTRAVTNPLAFAGGEVIAPAAGAALGGVDKAFDATARGLVTAGEGAAGIGRDVGRGIVNVAKGIGEAAQTSPDTMANWGIPIPGETPAPAPVVEAAPAAKPGNIFAGLADTVKNIFTASPEEMERRQNIWAGLAQDARTSEAPVDGAPPDIRWPAPPGHVRQVEPNSFYGATPTPTPAPMKRPEDEASLSFPSAM